MLSSDEFKGVIAVVDDDEYILEALQDWLSFEGYRVSAHLGARSLLEKLQPVAGGWNLNDDSTQPVPLDAVLADLNMPGMNGLELACHLKEHAPNLPIIIATAAGTLEQEQMTAKGVVWLMKPFKVDDIEEILLKQIAR